MVKRIFCNERQRKTQAQTLPPTLIFLLMTLILLCIAGGIVLTPQVETWLATDPFTPQCHFDEDRLFATGDPITIHSVNQGQNTLVELDTSYYNSYWSPDGQYLVAMKKSDNNFASIDFKNEGRVEWVRQDNQDWLVIREKLDNKETSLYLTYLYNPTDNEKCKLGWSTYSLEF